MYIETEVFTPLILTAISTAPFSTKMEDMKDIRNWSVTLGILFSPLLITGAGLYGVFYIAEKSTYIQ